MPKQINILLDDLEQVSQLKVPDVPLSRGPDNSDENLLQGDIKTKKVETRKGITIADPKTVHLGPRKPTENLD